MHINRQSSFEALTRSRSKNMGSPKKNVEEMKKTDQTTKSSSTNLFVVLRYADWVDILLMILGTTGAIGDGMSTNILLVFASRIMNSLGYGQTQQNRSNFMAEVEQVCAQHFHFCSCSCSFFFFLEILLTFSSFFGFSFGFCDKQCSLNFVYLGLSVMVVAFMGNFKITFFFFALFFF